jgi:hypothetical protein
MEEPGEATEEVHAAGEREEQEGFKCPQEPRRRRVLLRDACKRDRAAKEESAEDQLERLAQRDPAQLWLRLPEHQLVRLECEHIARRFGVVTHWGEAYRDVVNRGCD